MQFSHNILRDRLHKAAGIEQPLNWVKIELERLQNKRKTFLTLAELEHEIKTEVWCPSFLKLMYNRLLMGRLRYGKKSPDAPKYDFVKAMESKIKLYKENRNLELLVDIGNYAMLEFHIGEHPDRHFTPGDDTEHAELKK